MALRLMLHALAHPLSGSQAIRALRAFRKAQEHLRSVEGEDSICHQQLELACKWSGLDNNQVRQIVEMWMEKEPLPLLRGCIRPGLLDMLQQAKAADIRLGVFSDYVSGHKLEAMGIRQYFHAICAAQDADIGRFKPHPKGLEVTLQRLNVSAEHALYIGDRPTVDAEAARRAGMNAVIIGGEAAPPGATWLGIRTFEVLGKTLRQ